MSLGPCFRAMMLWLSMLVITTALCGCTFKVTANNVIMLDEYSRLLDPTGNIDCTNTSPKLCDGKHLTIMTYKQLDAAQREPYIQGLLDGLRNAPKGRDGKRHVLIFVHGGLNTQTGSVKRVSELASRITDAGYYPIFLNWRSSWSFNYFDHLFYVRQGEEWSTFSGFLTSPVVLAYDIGRGLFRAPLVWASQVSRVCRHFAVPLFPMT